MMNDILFGNNNGAVIKKLSGRYFKASKSRNIIAIIAIILTTILFTTIFTLGRCCTAKLPRPALLSGCGRDEKQVFLEK